MICFSNTSFNKSERQTTPKGWNLPLPRSLWAATLCTLPGTALAYDPLFTVNTFWIAMAGLFVAVTLAGICVHAIRKALKLSTTDETTAWESLAANVAETVLLLDKNGVVLYTNRPNEWTGALVGEPFDQRLHDDDRRKWASYLAETDASACANVVFHVTAANGAELLWEVRLSPVPDGPLGAKFLACCRDITERKRRDSTQNVLYKISLAASRIESVRDLMSVVVTQLNKLTDTANFYIALYDQATGLYSKPRWRDNGDSGSIETPQLDLTGGLTDYVRTTGKPLLMNEENRARLREVIGIKRCGSPAACWLGIPLRTNAGVVGVLVLQSYSDPHRYTYSDVALLTIVAGSLARAIERQRAIGALRQREAKLRLLTERLPALIWSQDEAGYITHVSGAALDVLQVPAPDWLGRKITNLLGCGKGNEFALEAARLAVAPAKLHLTGVHRSFDATVEAVFDETGHFMGATGVALDVTERDHADAELRRFFDINADSFVVLDQQGRVQRINETFSATTGYSWDEFNAKTLANVVHPDDAVAAQADMIAVFGGVPLIGRELRVVCKDGSCRWMSWNAVLGEDGRIYASGKDISHRREMEMALVEREEQLRLFVRHSPAALAMFDNDMRYLVCSERWIQDYRLGNRDIIGKTHYEVFPEIGEEWKAVHRRCLRGATEECSREPFARGDGTLDWVRWVVKPWLSGDGNIGGIIMFTEVITSQVEAEVELERSRSLARQIVDSSLDAVVAVDHHGAITEWNPQAVEIFGYTRDEAIGQQIDELIVPERFRSDHRNAFNNALHVGQRDTTNRQIQLPARRKNGSEFTVELSIGTIALGDRRHFSAFIRDVTEREARETELRENRARLADAQRIAKLGFWDWDAQNDEMQISAEKLELYARPGLNSPINFATFLDIVHPEDRPVFLELHRQMVEGLDRFEIQYRIVRASNEIRHAFSQGEVVRDASGRVIRIFGTTLDVTERVRAELRLKASEQRLALALEGSSDGFWDWNLVTGECYCSSRIVEWLECTSAEFVHTTEFVDSFMSPEDLQGFNHAFAEHVAGHTPQLQVEERFLTRNGKVVWLLTRGKVMEWDENGRPMRAVGTCTNITLRKNIETRAAQLGQILENATNEVFIVDVESGRILEANRRALANIGYSLEEVRELYAQDITEDKSPFSQREHVQAMLNGEADEIRNLGIRVRKDGTTYPFEHVVQLMEWYDRKVFVSFGTDISARLNAEQELGRLEGQLRHAQRLETIGTLAGGIAHDFNNILTPILGYADMAAADLEPGSRGRRDIEQVIQAAYRAKGLVQQILAFSRQSGQAKQPLRVDLVVKETLHLLRASLPPNVELTQNIHCVGNVLSDPTLINQIVMNLCTNAAQAIGADDGTIGVTLTYESVTPVANPDGNTLAPGEYAVLTVADSGGGMDEETLGRVFEPFFTTKEVGQGTGLGLSVVHGIVAAHAGAIRIQSALGKGTRVTVWLPLYGAIDLAAVSYDPAKISGTEHIILCDDDETIVLLGKEMLESFGYKVTAVADPVAALAALQEAAPRPSAIVVDDVMPILSGRDVALAAHDFDPDLPVILLSASAMHSPDPHTGSVVLAKPVSANELAQAVRDAIDLATQKALCKE
ncbi:MAG: PAS domain S-box protein [bacterium]|nr:PAS domain S-box protein [bacterium]